jgi:hypothetical protein
MSRLAGWIAENRVSIAMSDDNGSDSFAYLVTQLAQHPERAAQQSRQLLQTATHLDPTAAITHYSVGLYALQQWETLPAKERARVVQQLRSAVQLEPKYATVILQAFWECTQDRERVRTLTGGTPRKHCGASIVERLLGGDSRECGAPYFASCFFTSNFFGE